MVTFSRIREQGKELAQTLRFTARALWGASPLLTLVFLTVSAASGLSPLLQIWATRHLIDALAQGGRPGALGPAPLAVLAPLLPWVAALIGALVLDNLVSAVTPLLSTHLNERVSQTLERRIYVKATALELSAFESPDYYDKLSRARQALGGGMIRALEVGRQFVSGLVAVTGILVIIAQVNTSLALLLVAGGVSLTVLAARQSQEFRRINYQQSPEKRRLAYWRDLSTKRGPAAELRLFDLGGYLLERWRRLNEQLMEELLAARRRHALRSLQLTWGTGLLSGVVIAGIVYEGARGAITVGAIAGALYGLRQLEGFTGGMGWQIESLHSFYTNVRYLTEFLDMGGEEAARETPPPQPLRQGITFDNVAFTYPGRSEPALHEVDLHIRPGERLALVGENGAGKSTLARLLLGLYRPTQGRILVDGVDLGEIDPASWRAQAAAVFQTFVQYQLTARDNIGFGDARRLEDPDCIARAARQSGAHDVVSVLPAAYETLLGKGFDGAQDLSLGQWQKLALARAYLRDARVLVLDEPAASLDALAEQAVYEEFSRAAAGRTVLLISHRLGSARLADRIVFLERGRVLQTGTHDELLARGGPYAEMYRLQAEWYREPSGAEVGQSRGGT